MLTHLGRRIIYALAVAASALRRGPPRDYDEW
jgi:hypothetical protein